MGDDNFLASNHVASNVVVQVVLDVSTTSSRILYSAQTSHQSAFSTSYATQPTPSGR